MTDGQSGREHGREGPWNRDSCPETTTRPTPTLVHSGQWARVVSPPHSHSTSHYIYLTPLSPFLPYAFNTGFSTGKSINTDGPLLRRRCPSVLQAIRDCPLSPGPRNRRHASDRPAAAHPTTAAPESASATAASGLGHRRAHPRAVCESHRFDPGCLIAFLLPYCRWTDSSEGVLSSSLCSTYTLAHRCTLSFFFFFFSSLPSAVLVFCRPPHTIH